MLRLRGKPGDVEGARGLYAESASAADAMGVALYGRLAHERLAQ